MEYAIILKKSCWAKKSCDKCRGYPVIVHMGVSMIPEEQGVDGYKFKSKKHYRVDFVERDSHGSICSFPLECLKEISKEEYERKKEFLALAGR